MPVLRDFRPEERPQSVVLHTDRRPMRREDFDIGHVCSGLSKQIGSQQGAIFIQRIRGVGGEPCLVCGKPECPFQYSPTGILWKFDQAGNPVCMVQESTSIQKVRQVVDVETPQFISISKEDSERYLKAMAERAESNRPKDLTERVMMLEGQTGRILSLLEGIAGKVMPDETVSRETVKVDEPKEESLPEALYEPKPATEEELNAAMPAFNPQMTEDKYALSQEQKAAEVTVSPRKRGRPKKV